MTTANTARPRVWSGKTISFPGNRTPVTTEPKEYVRGMAMLTHMNYGDFITRKEMRPIHISQCAEQGLRVLADLPHETKSVCPILVKSIDMAKTKKTSIFKMDAKKLCLSRPLNWDLVPVSIVFNYAVGCCSKHLMCLNEGETVILATESFRYKQTENFIGLSCGEAYGEFLIYCHPADRGLVGNEWFLFDRRRR